METDETTATRPPLEVHPTHERPHPSVREYVKIAVVLAVVTLLEVVLFYVEAIPDVVLTLSLLVLAVIKFALVALWYMHLRFDSRLFSRLFITGIALALTVFLVVLLTFGLLLG